MITKLINYYNLENLYITKIRNKNYVKSNDRIYILYEIDKNKNKQEIIEAYKITKNYPEFEKIIFNRKNMMFTNIDNKEYILIEKKYYKKQIVKRIIVNDEIKYLDRSNWIRLWEKKIDYIEKTYYHIKGENIIIDESIYYFIGMAEVAISYIKNNSSKYNRKNEKIICSKTYDEMEIYNPLNIIVDYPEREISEYLKKIFWKNEYTEELAVKYLEKNIINCNLSSIYARMLFPNFYFDAYLKCITNNNETEEIVKIINRLNEYENYTKLIFNTLKHASQKLDEVKWL